MQKDSTNQETTIKDLFKLGAHFGFSRSRRHPSVNSFIFGFKNKTAVIDLEKSLAQLDTVKDFVRKLASEGKQILFVGNKLEARNIIKTYASVIDQPFVAERWIGGTLTNFKQIRRRVDKLQDIRSKEKTGGLDIYTKKERVLINIEKEKLEKLFSGIEVMEKMPAAMFVVDSDAEKIAVEEAHQMRIPVISLSNSDCDIRGVEYPIIANDANRQSIEYFIGEIVEAYRQGKTAAQTVAKEKMSEVAGA